MHPKFKFFIPHVLPLIYGVLLWILFVKAGDFFSGTIVSWSFIALGPFVMGLMTTFLGIKFNSRTDYWVYIAPSLTLFVGLLLSTITKLEALLCVILAAPIMVIPAFLGGIVAGAIMKKADRKLHMNFLVFLPVAASFLENQWEQPHERVRVKDSIEIKATPEIIWEHIASVEAISEEELPFQFIYLLDFPKPISAEIDKHEIGGKRLAIFEREVSFFEEITVWEKNETLSFTIHADPEFIPQSAFDQHIIVGGRFYDVLDGTYKIEKTDNGCILHLESNHRLTSPFNKYAGWWSEWIMNQIQGSILTVIKNRCELEI